MRLRLRRVRLLLPLLVALVVIPGTVLAASNRTWQVSVSPSTIFINTETNIRLTVTNTGGSGGGQEITCVRVQLPGSFDLSDAKVVSVYGETSGAAYSAWIPVVSGNVVTFKEPKDDYPLIGSSSPQDQAVFRITGTSSSLLAMSFTMNAADHPGKANETKCGSGDDFPTKTPSVLVVPIQGPAPTPTPTPTPAPTPTPTPHPTPTPTPRPTPTPTPSPHPTPKPTPTPTPTPSGSRPPGATATPRPAPTPTPDATPPPSETADPSAEASPQATASTSPSASALPVAPTAGASVGPPVANPSDDPGSGGGTSGGNGTDGGGFVIPGEDSSGSGGTPVEGMDDTAVSVLAQLPGGLLPFAGPAVVLGFPGLLVLLAVGAQAFGGLAWLPVARRKLGTFGLRTKA